MSEIRYYKGKYRVEVLQKSKGNWMVQALEFIPTKNKGGILTDWICDLDKFVTCPRLLWRKRRGANKK